MRKKRKLLPDQTSWCARFPPDVGTRVEVHVTKSRWAGLPPPFFKHGWYHAVVVEQYLFEPDSEDEDDEFNEDDVRVSLRFEKEVDQSAQIRTEFGSLDFESNVNSIQVKVDLPRTVAMQPRARIRRLFKTVLMLQQLRHRAILNTLSALSTQRSSLSSFLRWCPEDVLGLLAHHIQA